MVDIAPVAYADRLSPFAEAMRSIDMLAAASRAEVQQRLAETVPDAGVVPFLMQNLVTRNEHLDWRVNLAGIARRSRAVRLPARTAQPALRRPLHVIAGGRSDYVAQRDGAAFQPMFAAAAVEVIEEAGHWVHADAPQRFLARPARARRQGWTRTRRRCGLTDHRRQP